jgi:hypothetical protein
MAERLGVEAVATVVPHDRVSDPAVSLIERRAYISLVPGTLWRRRL